MKKAQNMSVGTIVMVVLGLVVLAILILVVRQQVTKGASRFSEIGEGVGGSGCFNLLEGRSCVKGSCPPDMEGVSGQWSDCQDKTTKTGSTYICCKKKEG